jgi:hypothetical protein
MYYLRTRAAVDALKGLGIDTSSTKTNDTTPSINNVEVPTNNTLISEQTPELVMLTQRPDDSPFECEGCGS